MTAHSKSYTLKVKMTPELQRRLFEAAEQRGESAALIAREALQDYLAKVGAVEEGRAVYGFSKDAPKKPRKIS